MLNNRYNPLPNALIYVATHVNSFVSQPNLRIRVGVVPNLVVVEVKRNGKTTLEP